MKLGKVDSWFAVQDAVDGEPIYVAWGGTGQWYCPTSAPSTGTGMKDDIYRGCYFVVPRPCTLDRLAIEHLVAATGGTETARIGIYAVTDGLPGALLLDSGTVDFTATPAINEIDVNLALAAGPILVGAVFTGTATGTATVRITTGNYPVLFSHSTVSRAMTGGSAALSKTMSGGTLSDPFGAVGGGTTSVPRIALKLT